MTATFWQHDKYPSNQERRGKNPSYHLTLTDTDLMDLSKPNDMSLIPDNIHDTKRDDKTPTTFLSLPRELRQAVLYDTYNHHADTRPFITFPDGCDSVTFNSYCVDPAGRLVRLSSHVDSWFDLLSRVLPIIKEDLGFVKERWTEDIKKGVPTQRDRSVALANDAYAREMVSGELILWGHALRGQAKRGRWLGGSRLRIWRIPPIQG